MCAGGESYKDAGGNYLPLCGGAGSGADHTCGVCQFVIVTR